MTEKNTLHARLEKARAIIAAPELPQLKEQQSKARAFFERLYDLRKTGLTKPAQDAEFGDAKNSHKKADSKVENALAEIQKARQEVAYLERLLNSADSLTQAREGWRIASAAHIEAAKQSESARDNLARIKSLLAEEENKSLTAKDAQRAALLVELGLSDKSDGATAAASAKSLIGSDARADALRSVLPEAEARVLQADADVVACDKATGRAEQSILDAKQSIAELNHALALEQYQAAYLQMTGAFFAATNAPPPRINPCDVTGAVCEAVAQSLRASAEIGE